MESHDFAIIFCVICITVFLFVAFMAWLLEYKIPKSKKQ